uniref:Cystin 1 n=1 Tax=Myotis myotis TaxID=51298 RepID=A0A7J7U4H4_MYOMY|nr:cystin 1 [Myotis myotis]
MLAAAAAESTGCLGPPVEEDVFRGSRKMECFFPSINCHPPSDGRDETLRLLDQLLAESAAWAPGEPAPRRPARPPPAAGAGSRVSPEHRAEDPPESRSASEAPGSSQERPERRSVILYDCSEEELMASIEQEYCH